MVTTYRYGETRTDFALRLGVARKVPRVKHGQRPFDLLLQILSPSPKLEERFQNKHLSLAKFAVAYRAEMRRPEPRQIIALVAFLAEEQPISLGCFCEDDAACHRSILKCLIEEATPRRAPWMGRRESTSPVCLLGDADF